MHSVTRRQTLADLLRRSAARTPDKLAIVCGEIRWTYAEFDRFSSASPPGSRSGASSRATASRFLRAIRTPSPRCASRWRGLAPCWCRSISC